MIYTGIEKLFKSNFKKNKDKTHYCIPKELLKALLDNTIDLLNKYESHGARYHNEQRAQSYIAELKNEIEQVTEILKS